MPIDQGQALRDQGFVGTRALDISAGHPGTPVSGWFNPLGQTSKARYGIDLTQIEFVPEQYAGPHPGQPSEPGRPPNSEAPRLLPLVLARLGVAVVPDGWLVEDLDMLVGATRWVIDQALEMGLVEAQAGGSGGGGPIEPPPVKLPPTLPVSGLHPLSPASVRVEELRQLALIALNNDTWTAGLFFALENAGTWAGLKPFAVEALRFYRRLRAKLGDPREIPAEDR